MNRSRPSAAIGLAAAALLSAGACASSTDSGAAEPTLASRSSTVDSPATQHTRSSQVPSTTSSPTTSKTKPTASSSTPSSTPPSSATATAPSTSTSPPLEPDSSPRRAKLAQIAAKRLPGFNDEWSWTDVRRVQSPQSLCMQSTMMSIGAVKEASTEFMSTATKTASAVQITGVFPDEHTALTAAAVLTAWHDKCADRATKDLELESVEVSGPREVSTSVGAGRQLMVTYGPVPGQPDSEWFHSEGFVRDGDTITYVTYESAGQDYNYEVGREPIDRGLSVAGDYLRRTRGS